MAAPKADSSWSIVQTIKQSPPVDTTSPYDISTLAGKTIIVTGGASGFGAAFSRKWASNGAHIIIGDINDQAGEDLVAELRSLPGSSQNHHFQHCDVTSWDDQVALFKLARKVSPNGCINGVLAGAGVVETRDLINGPNFDVPTPLNEDDDTPPKPNLRVLGINLTGVMYTTHLAVFHLQRNPEGPGSQDRHILLVSSIAGVIPLPGQTEYTVSKHGVMGLFRVMRSSSWRWGIRCNVVNPYFVDTPLINSRGVALCAGAGMAQIEDVIDAGTRLMADEKIVGRGLAIGPKVRVVDDDETGEPVLVESTGAGREQAVWEIYGHDYEQVEIFVYRFVKLMNAVRAVRGWVGVLKDIIKIWRKPAVTTNAR